MLKRSMPVERKSITRKLKIGDLKGFVTVGLYDDGTPGEVFLTIKQVGSFERGMCHALALMISLALQYGVPLKKIASKLTHLKFEPSGFTGKSDIPSVDSLPDYLGKWLSKTFLHLQEEGCSYNHQTLVESSVYKTCPDCGKDLE